MPKTSTLTQNKHPEINKDTAGFTGTGSDASLDKPSEMIISNILQFSRNLEISKSNYVGYIENLKS